MVDTLAVPVFGNAGSIVFCAEPMEQAMPDLTVQTPEETDLARLIVKTLNLDITAHLSTHWRRCLAMVSGF